MSGKKRLFVDMDGTLAEWRELSLNIEDYESKEEVNRRIYEILTTPGYFSSLTPYDNVSAAIRMLKEDSCLEDKMEIYILSCVIETDKVPNPSSEKYFWLGEHLPEIPIEHIIFVPDGENKTAHIPGGVSSDDYLLDDYTKNLTEFEDAGGCGIKLMNGINGSKGTWHGACISKNDAASEIANGLLRKMDFSEKYLYESKELLENNER